MLPVQAVRFRYDRKTGALVSRTILEEYEIDEEKFGGMVATAITGMHFDDIVQKLNGQNADGPPNSLYPRTEDG